MEGIVKLRNVFFLIVLAMIIFSTHGCKSSGCGCGRTVDRKEKATVDKKEKAKEEAIKKLNDKKCKDIVITRTEDRNGKIRVYASFTDARGQKIKDDFVYEY